MIHNYDKQSTVNPNEYSQITTINQKEMYSDGNEVEDNTMEFMKKKLMKKKNESKLKSNYLNFTNPIQSFGATGMNKQRTATIIHNAHNSNLSQKATTPGTSTISNSNLKLNLTK